MKLKLALLVWPAILCVRPAHALESFGGSCATKGQWSKDALEQSKAIANTITALRDDPNCKGIESVLPRIQDMQASLDSQSSDESLTRNKQEELHSTISSLREALEHGGELAADVAGPLTMLTAQAAPLMQQAAAERANRAVTTSTTLVDEVLKVMPNYQLCMNNHPDQRLAIVGASIQMIGSLASGGEGITARLGNTVGSLVNYMRDSNYAKLLRGTNENQYWTSMSCLVETTSQTYCRANEAFSLLDFQATNARGSAAKPGQPSLIDGYDMMVRELPVVSDWLTKVQFGVTPRVSTDADFKNTTLDAMNNVQKAANGMRGAYSEEMLQYENLTSLRDKKNLALETVNKLNEALLSNAGSVYAAYGRGGAQSSPGDRNFFVSTQNPDVLPYYLIGLKDIPEVVQQAREKNGNMTKFSAWAIGKGDYQEAFSDPDQTMRTIGERLGEIIDQSMDKASAYFNQRMIVDSQNLVNESLTSNTLNVANSLKNIRNYLNALVPRAKADSENGVKIVPSLVDTVQRIDRVLASYDGVKKKVDDIMAASELVGTANQCTTQPQQDALTAQVRQILDRIAPGSGPVDFNNMDDALKKRINSVYVDLINKVYSEFNVLLQRNGFLQNRVSTFVKYDYSDRIKNKDKMTDYQKQILTVSGRSMMDEMIKVNQLNPVQTEQDLSSAQVVNTKNIEAVSSLLGDNFHEAIDAMNQRTGGEVRSTETKGGSGWFGAPKAVDVVVAGTGDENHAFDQFRSKLCVQTLAFSNWQDYQPYCKGSVLSSRFEKDNPTLKGLSVKYDDLAKDRVKEPSGSKYVCALRNYIQQNQAYWLVQQGIGE